MSDSPDLLPLQTHKKSQNTFSRRLSYIEEGAIESALCRPIMEVRAEDHRFDRYSRQTACMGMRRPICGLPAFVLHRIKNW
jgi:hypothetical protein